MTCLPRLVYNRPITSAERNRKKKENREQHRMKTAIAPYGSQILTRTNRLGIASYGELARKVENAEARVQVGL